ncbi:hypothetical protein R6Q57_002187 [Mikania cordata]
MKEGSSRGGSSTKKFIKPRPKNVQTAQMNPFNTLGVSSTNVISESTNLLLRSNEHGSIFAIFNNNLIRGNYHDHNQDDSDSSEHNKSVQAKSEEEEEEEPVRRTGKKPMRKKAPAKCWSDEEEVVLARSWLTISENPDVGKAQKRDGFYRKLFFNIVTDHFHHLMNDKSRTVDQIYSKWNNMNSSIKKCNGFYQQASMNRKSGEGDEQVLKKAMKNYKSVVKSNGFAHIQAWEMVVSHNLQQKSRSHESMGSANAHININLDDDEDININLDREGPRIYYEPDRPTRKGKRSAASSSSYEELIQQMAEFNSFNKEESQQRFRLREEKLRVLQEEKDASIQLMRR